jgi:WASH complex subunit 7
VLEVARNIPIFVTRYTYSVNGQMFVEIPADNKTMNSMSVSHFTNSIRTHGTGVYWNYLLQNDLKKL